MPTIQSLRIPLLHRRIISFSRQYKILSSFSSSLCNTRNYASSSHNESHHHPITAKSDDPQTESKLHPEEYLQVARNWPHEYHYPGNFIARSGPEYDEKPTLLGHTLENPLGGDTPREDFSAPFWTAFLGFSVIMMAVWRINDYVTNHGAQENPIHTRLKEYIPSVDKLHESTKNWLAFRQREADDRLIRNSWQPDRAWTPCFDGMFDRKSDWRITPGTQIDTHDIKFKHTWERDDDLFGPPYPKSGK